MLLKYADYDIVFQEIPNEVTLAINLSACPYRCMGCHSPHLQTDVGEPLTEENLAILLRKYGKVVTCVCFMGGDNSPDAIQQLARYLNTQTTFSVKVGWYSGRKELPEGFALKDFHYIKLGAYIESLGGLKSSLTNQRLYRIENGEMVNITHLLQRSISPV